MPSVQIDSKKTLQRNGKREDDEGVSMFTMNDLISPFHSVRAISVSSLGGNFAAVETMETHSENQSVSQASVTILCAVMGAGILGLPYALASTGWFGLIFLIGFGITTCYTAVCISDCAERYHEMDDENYSSKIPKTSRLTFSDIGRRALGSFGEVLSVIIQIGCTVGPCTLYLILLGDLLEIFFPFWSKKMWMVLCYAILCIFTVARTLKELTIIAYFGFFSSLLVAAIVFVYSTFFSENLVVPEIDLTKDRIPSPTALSFFLGLGTFCFAYNGHTLFLEIKHCLKDEKDFFKATLGAYLSCVFTYAPLAISVFAAVGNLLLHPDTHGDDALYLLPKDSVLSIIGIVSIGIHVFVAYLVFLNPLFLFIERYFKIEPFLVLPKILPDPLKHKRLLSTNILSNRDKEGELLEDQEDTEEEEAGTPFTEGKGEDHFSQKRIPSYFTSNQSARAIFHLTTRRYLPHHQRGMSLENVSSSFFHSRTPSQKNTRVRFKESQSAHVYGNSHLMSPSDVLSPGSPPLGAAFGLIGGKSSQPSVHALAKKNGDHRRATSFASSIDSHAPPPLSINKLHSSVISSVAGNNVPSLHQSVCGSEGTETAKEEGEHSHNISPLLTQGDAADLLKLQETDEDVLKDEEKKGEESSREKKEKRDSERIVIKQEESEGSEDSLTGKLKLHDAVARKEREEREEMNVDEEENKPTFRNTVGAMLLCRISVTFPLLLVAVFIPSFGAIQSFVGGTFTSMQCLTLPCLFVNLLHPKGHPRLSARRRTLNWAITALGFCVALCATISALWKAIDATTSHDD